MIFKFCWNPTSITNETNLLTRLAGPLCESFSMKAANYSRDIIFDSCQPSRLFSSTIIKLSLIENAINSKFKKEKKTIIQTTFFANWIDYSNFKNFKNYNSNYFPRKFRLFKLRKFRKRIFLEKKETIKYHPYRWLTRNFKKSSHWSFPLKKKKKKERGETRSITNISSLPSWLIIITSPLLYSLTRERGNPPLFVECRTASGKGNSLSPRRRNLLATPGGPRFLV